MIDGVTVAGSWPGQVAQPTSTPLDLTPGWHDVIFDYSQDVGGDSVRLETSTPDIPLQPIAPTALRPVRTTGLLGYATSPTLALVDATAAGQPGVAMMPFAIATPPGSVVDFADLVLPAQHRAAHRLAVTLAQAAGSDPVPTPAMPVFDDYDDDAPDRTVFAGQPANGAWTATFTDSVYSGYAGWHTAVRSWSAMHGGPAGPFAPQSTYVSAPHPTPGAIRRSTRSKVAADLQGATMTIEAPHVGADGAVDGELDDRHTAPRSRPATSCSTGSRSTADGWQYPTVDKVEIDYDMAGAPADGRPRSHVVTVRQMPNLLAMSFEGELAPSFTLHCLDAGRTLPDGWGLGYYPGGRAVGGDPQGAGAAAGLDPQPARAGVGAGRVVAVRAPHPPRDVGRAVGREHAAVRAHVGPPRLADRRTPAASIASPPTSPGPFEPVGSTDTEQHLLRAAQPVRRARLAQPRPTSTSTCCAAGSTSSTRSAS